MNKRTPLLVGIIAIAAVVGFAIWRSMASGVPVEVTEATTGSIREYVDERGMTRLPTTHLITMPSSGRVAAIDLVEGTPVAAGQTVAHLVPSDLELAVEQATAAVERLDASIAQQGNVAVEKTAKLQAEQFVESMDATVQAAAARVESGEAKYAYAERNLSRTRRLAEAKAATTDQLEQAQVQMVESEVDYRQDRLVHAAMIALQAATNLMPTMVQQYIDRQLENIDVLKKQKAEAEVARRMALQDQRRGTMESPIDGVVLRRQVTNEQFLPAGTTLLEIGDLAQLEVEADVLSLDVVDARRGDPVEIYGPTIGPEPVRGTIHRIYPAGFTKISSLGVEQQRVKVVVRFEPADLERIRREQDVGVGYRVRVRIITAEKSGALLVPRSALFRATGSRWQLYVVRNGRAEVRDVEIGLINDRHAEVLSGLEPGELVVRSPESNLAPGHRVELRRED